MRTVSSALAFLLPSRSRTPPSSPPPLRQHPEQKVLKPQHRLTDEPPPALSDGMGVCPCAFSCVSLVSVCTPAAEVSVTFS